MLKPPLLSVKKVKLNIIRQPAGAYVNGRWVQSTQNPTTIPIDANVQPWHIKQDTLLLPEGDRSRRCLKVYTHFKLQGRQEGSTPKEGDKFVWTDGYIYEVMHVYAYEMGILDHTKALAVRRELT